MSSRRNLIKTLGVGLLAGGVVNTAFANSKPEVEGGTVKFYATVASLKGERKIKEGDVVKTLGFHLLNDGGDAIYLIQASQDKYGAGIPLQNGLFANLINVNAVNYKMFGTVCDGNHDDGIEIKKAHQFANGENLPVINLSGEFWIKETNGIEILGQVDWGHSIFHIDETFNTPKAFKFLINSRRKIAKKDFSASDKASIIRQLVPGVDSIAELTSCRGNLIYIEDTNDRIGFRAGERFTGQSWARQELFYVEEHGKVVGEIAYSFKDYTTLEVIPVDDTYLVVNGGCFVLSGNSSGKGYTKNGIGIQRSRTFITNQVIRLEEGAVDTAPNARTGFYNFSKVYDVKLENIRLIPYEQDRAGKEKDVPAGTYGISGNRILCATFRNLTAEGSVVHWGVFGTNMNKSFRIENCSLNRVDVHFHCWNLSILNTRIGFRGISVTGGGDLIIQNTVVESRSFVNFRRDFGAKWDGDIRISNCKYIPTASSLNSFLDFNPADFDYKYPIIFGKSIVAENIVVDKRYSTSSSPIYLLNLPNFSKMKHGESVLFPDDITFSNINGHGKNSGVRLMNLTNPSGYLLSSQGGYDGIELNANVRMFVDNVDLEDFSNLKNMDNTYHLNVQKAEVGIVDQDGMILELELANCKNVALNLEGSTTRFIARNSTISRIKSKGKDKLRGKIILNDCSILPIVTSKENILLELDSTLGTTLTNCTVYSPKIASKFAPQELGVYTFLKINESLKLNHLNTRLGNDILSYLKTTNTKLTPKFIEMLKVSSDMDA